MKKIKNLVAILLVVALLLGSTMFLNSVKAAILDKDTGVEYAPSTKKSKYSYNGLAKKTSNKFEFNAEEFLIIYSLNSTGGNVVKMDRQELNDELIQIFGYDVTTNELKPGSVWDDGRIDAKDASLILMLSKGYDDNDAHETAEMMINWEIYAQDIIYSLADYLQISKDDISLVTKVTTPVISGITTEEKSYSVNNSTKFTESILTQIADNEVINLRASEKYYNDNISDGSVPYNTDAYPIIIQQILTATATTKDGAEYKMVLGTDNNYYLFQTKEAEKTPEPDPEEKEFKTELTYRAEDSVKKVDGKMDKDVFLPPYYTDEDKDAKKDTDAYGIITSTTDEDIVATNDVALTDKNVKGNPNSEGWYYPDLTNKKVIEKEYPFDDFNNPKDNGAVKETVKLTGKDGGIDNQTPNIRWTLRRINYEKKTNEDKSITVTITYNLPIDKNSIPEGWKPIVDEDGGIRKITRTFKEGEDYKKNVTVEQNGESTATVTTPVEVEWKKDDSKANKVIPQTGAFTLVLIAIVGGAAVFAYTRYRKLN